MININVSPFAMAFLLSTSSVESIPINRIVNGSLIDLPLDSVSDLDASDFLIFFSLEIITFVSFSISSYEIFTFIIAL